MRRCATICGKARACCFAADDGVSYAAGGIRISIRQPPPAATPTVWCGFSACRMRCRTAPPCRVHALRRLGSGAMSCWRATGASRYAACSDLSLGSPRRSCRGPATWASLPRDSARPSFPWPSVETYLRASTAAPGCVVRTAEIAPLTHVCQVPSRHSARSRLTPRGGGRPPVGARLEGAVECG